MESQGETISLQDVGNVHSNVVLRRHRTSTSGRRRNVAIIEETLVSVDNNSIHQELTLLNSGENYYAVDHKFEQTEDSISGVGDRAGILIIIKLISGLSTMYIVSKQDIYTPA